MNQAEYLSAKPFPHAYLSGLIEEDLLRNATKELLEFFDKTKDDGNLWRIKKNENSRKYGTSHIDKIGPNSQKVFDHLFSDQFLSFLSNLTGIENLIPDKTLEGGGYHLIERGGFLKVHADFNYQKQLQLYRRVNLLYYLNEDWRPEYGGDLELWDKEKCFASYSPTFGKSVIFTTSDTSFHGHPTPLNTPDGLYRKSIAVYYYTKDKPEDISEDYHSTIYI